MRWLWGALATSAIAVCGCGSSGGSGAFTGGPEDSGRFVRRNDARKPPPRRRLQRRSGPHVHASHLRPSGRELRRRRRRVWRDHFVRHVRNGPVLRRRGHPQRVRRPDLRPQDVRRSERRDSVRPASRRLRRSHRDSVRDLHRAPDLRRRGDAERVRRHRGVRPRDGDHRVHHVDRHPDELRSHGRRLRRHGHVRHGGPRVPRVRRAAEQATPTSAGRPP